MAGRGRGTASLMSVVLEQQSGSSPPSFQKAVDESSSKKVKERDTMHTSQEDSRNAVRPSPREEASSPLGVFGIRTQPNNPLPSGGRGLMPPGHFQKTSPPKDSPQGQPEKKLLSSPTSGILPNVKDKTPELQSAMAYLNKFAKGGHKGAAWANILGMLDQQFRMKQIEYDGQWPHEKKGLCSALLFPLFYRFTVRRMKS